MRVIKRYSNRKLYDTVTKQYVTLDQIADLVREGSQLQVVDNATGEDLTTLALSQIILEKEKKQKGFLPHSVLNALVEAGGKPISSLRQRLESPLGFLRQVDDEIDRRIKSLIQRGELAEEHGWKLRNLLLDLSPLSGSKNQLIDDEIERVIKNKEIPTNEDIQNLIEQIESLSKKINALE